MDHSSTVDRSLSSCAFVSMDELYPSLAQCAVVSAAFKILLFPA